MLRHGSGTAARLTESRLRTDAAAAASQLEQLLPAPGERHGARHQHEQHDQHKQWQHCQWSGSWQCVTGRRRRRRRRRLTTSSAHVSSTPQSASQTQVSGSLSWTDLDSISHMFLSLSLSLFAGVWIRNVAIRAMRSRQIILALLLELAMLLAGLSMVVSRAYQ